MLSKRLSSLIAVGALPASIVSMMGDFFSSVGGWRVALVLGFLSLLLAALTWVWAATGGLTRKSAFWMQWIQKDTDLAWITEVKRPRDFHVIHVFLVFGLISLALSSISYSKAAQGGALASQVPQVRAWQDELGLLNSIESKVGEIVANSDRIYDEVRKGKKETSSDPRKELNNLGLEWKSHVFQEAVKSGDLKVVGLFVEVGVLPNGSSDVIKEAIRADNDSVYQILRSHELGLSADACIEIGMDSVLYERSKPSQVSFLKGICSSDKLSEKIASETKLAESKHARKMTLLKEWEQLIRSGEVAGARSYEICTEIRAAAGDCMVIIPSLNRSSSVEHFAPKSGELMRWKSLARLLLG